MKEIWLDGNLLTGERYERMCEMLNAYTHILRTMLSEEFMSLDVYSPYIIEDTVASNNPNLVYRGFDHVDLTIVNPSGDITYEDIGVAGIADLTDDVKIAMTLAAQKAFLAGMIERFCCDNRTGLLH